ncbi:hypothetical protein WMY93_032768 [Mugilogobius chulae]|uniref:Uncharacterized protein n=1 Tax=Mugilogobius chulae TaxID=88201 RepID=A0AAW0MKD5_9GOBI
MKVVSQVRERQVQVKSQFKERQVQVKERQVQVKERQVQVESRVKERQVQVESRVKERQVQVESQIKEREVQVKERQVQVKTQVKDKSKSKRDKSKSRPKLKRDKSKSSLESKRESPSQRETSPSQVQQKEQQVSAAKPRPPPYLLQPDPHRGIVGKQSTPEKESVKSSVTQEDTLAWEKSQESPQERKTKLWAQAVASLHQPLSKSDAIFVRETLHNTEHICNTHTMHKTMRNAMGILKVNVEGLKLPLRSTTAGLIDR